MENGNKQLPLVRSGESINYLEHVVWKHKTIPKTNVQYMHKKYEFGGLGIM